jgi:hypothetical protein
MQTFLPFYDFEHCAMVLDDRRLGKQRIEAKQIIQVLDNPDAKGWRNHPAVRMWDGYIMSLCYYGMAMCTEWARRGFNDNTRDWFEARCISEFANNEARGVQHDSRKPPWMADARLYVSHASNLIRKDPHYYELIWPQIPNGVPYLWPSKESYVSDLPLELSFTRVEFLLCLNDNCPAAFCDKNNKVIVDRYSSYGWSCSYNINCPHCDRELDITAVDGFDPFLFTFERRSLEELRAQGKRARAEAERSGIKPGAVM